MTYELKSSPEHDSIRHFDHDRMPLNFVVTRLMGHDPEMLKYLYNYSIGATTEGQQSTSGSPNLLRV